MTKLRLILDQDDVLADTHGRLADIVVRDFGTGLLREDFYKTSFHKILPSELHQRLYKIIQEPGIFQRYSFGSQRSGNCFPAQQKI